MLVNSLCKQLVYWTHLPNTHGKISPGNLVGMQWFQDYLKPFSADVLNVRFVIIGNQSCRVGFLIDFQLQSNYQGTVIKI